MAYTNLRLENFTLTDSLVFANDNSPSQDNYALCQVRYYFKAVRRQLDLSDDI